MTVQGIAITNRRERLMNKTLFKVLKFIHDRFGIFINPFDLRPKNIYRNIKAKLAIRRG